jgi:hypothetical protein
VPTWVPVLVVIGIALGSAAFGFAFSTARRLVKTETKLDAHIEEHAKYLVDVPQMRADIAKLLEGNQVFWKVIGPHMSSIIQSPHTLERDHLVRKMDEGSLTYEEALVLNSMLGHALDEATNNMDKVAFAFKLAQVRVFLVQLDMDRKGRV